MNLIQRFAVIVSGSLKRRSPKNSSSMILRRSMSGTTASPGGTALSYNPFDILQFIKTAQYKNYWFESGTPRFLLKLMEENSYFIPDLEEIEVSREKYLRSV